MTTASRTVDTANRAYHERLKTLLPGGVHYNFNMPWEETPIHFTDGRGSRLTDVDGNEYLDLYARFGAMILGHHHEEYLDALRGAMETVLCVSHGEQDLLPLELMHEHIPSAERIRFGLSGSEIVQMALRVARAHTGRNEFLRFVNHYHGNADNVLGGRVEDSQDPVPVEFRGDYKGTAGRAGGMLAQSWMIPWNDLDALERFFARSGDRLAAALTEPVCVNGGSIMPAPGYLQRLRELCTEHGVVLVFDEMITGMRMGLGGAQAAFGVTPDLSTFGKAIAGGGLPVSAMTGRADIMAPLETKKVVHAGTFNGYPLGSAAVAATFTVLGRDDQAALLAMNARGARIGEILTDLATEVGLPFIVQGPPGCASFHVCETALESPDEYTFDVMSKDIIVAAALQRHGVLISSISRLYPNVQLTDADLDLLDERGRPALAEAAAVIAEIS